MREDLRTISLLGYSLSHKAQLTGVFQFKFPLLLNIHEKPELLIAFQRCLFIVIIVYYTLLSVWPR